MLHSCLLYLNMMYKCNKQLCYWILTTHTCAYILNIDAAVWRMRASHVLYEKGTLNLFVDSPWIPLGVPEYFHTPAPAVWSHSPKNRTAPLLSHYRPPRWRLFCNYFPPPSLPLSAPSSMTMRVFATRESTCRISYMRGGTHTKCRNIRVHRIKPGGSYG